MTFSKSIRDLSDARIPDYIDDPGRFTLDHYEVHISAKRVREGNGTILLLKYVPNDGTWHHVEMIHTPETEKIYIDGKQVYPEKVKLSKQDRELRKLERSYWRNT